MTKEQKYYKDIILADLKIVKKFYNSDNKFERLLAAYHVEKAIEFTMKLKASFIGLDLWKTSILDVFDECKKNKIDIPKYIVNNIDRLSSWEYDCRYVSTIVVRRDMVFKFYGIVVEWLNKILLNS